MRKSFLILAFFFLPTACHAGHTIIQQNQCNAPYPGTQYRAVCAFSNPIIAGDGIVAIIFGFGIQYPSCVATDSNSQIYTSGHEALSVADTAQITAWVVFSAIGGATTVTATCNSFDYTSVFIYEVQGAIGQPNLIDQFNHGTCTSCSIQTTGSITTTQNQEIVFSAGFVYDTVFATGWSDTAGFVNPIAQNSPMGPEFASYHGVDMVVSSTGTFSNNMSFTGGPSNGTYVNMIESMSFGPPLCSPTPVQIAKCTNINVGSPGTASCSINVVPNSIVVISGTASHAYNVFDSNGWVAQGLFRYFQIVADPGGGNITEGISPWGTGTHSGTDTFSVNQTQFNIGASIVVTEWSGLQGLSGGTVPGFIVADSNVGTSSTASGSGNISGGNLAPSQIGDVLVVFGTAAANGQTLSIGSGYSQDENYNYTEATLGTYVTAAQESEIGLSTGPFAANFSVSASGVWAITGIALSPQACTLRPRNRTQVY